MLTTDLGAIDSGRGGFVQDATGALAVYLDGTIVALPAGVQVRIGGTIDSRYGLLTLRTSAADVVVLGPASLPAPLASGTGALGEALEARRVAVSGEVVEAPTAMADGTGLMVDDGTGAVRVVVGPAAQGWSSIARGDRVAAVGPLGQRDSSGTGLAGYRVHATLPGELTVLAPAPSPEPSPPPSPDPSPTASPGPSSGPDPSPDPSAEPTPSVAPSPSISPAPSPSPGGSDLVPIADARSAPVGNVVHVAGTVTAEPGRLGRPPLLAIQDESGGIVVHLPDGAPPILRGGALEVVGRLAAPYGQLEVRPALSDLLASDDGQTVAALEVGADEVAEPLEAALVSLALRVQAAPVRASSGDLLVDVTDAAGHRTRLAVDAGSDIPRAAFVVGRWYRATGVIGQHASRTGALDGYRVWLRGPEDLVGVAAPAGGASPSPTPAAGVTPRSIAAALRAGDIPVVIEAIVTAGSRLLDSTGRRIVVQDASGAVEVLLPAARSVAVGDRVRVEGRIGQAYGAPRLRATAFAVRGHGAAPAPVALAGLPGAAHTWRLVRLTGTLVDVRKLGERWSADVQVPAGRVLVTGLAGAGVPVGLLREGATVTVAGIVRPAYPSASDRRPAVLPRSRADIRVTASSGRTPGAAAAGRTTTSGGSVGTGDPDAAAAGGAGAGAGTAAAATAPEADLATIGERVGERVRVGGIARQVAADTVLLDDGTALAAVVLVGGAHERLEDVRTGDLVSATGTVAWNGEPQVVVDDPLDLMLATAIVEPDPAVTGSAGAPATAPPGGLGADPEAGSAPAAPDPRPLALALVAVLLVVGGSLALGFRRLSARRVGGGAPAIQRRLADLAAVASRAPGVGRIAAAERLAPARAAPAPPGRDHP